MPSRLSPVWCDAFGSLQRRTGIAYVNAWAGIWEGAAPRATWEAQAFLLRLTVLGKRESPINSPRKRLRILTSARCNQHVLASLDRVSSRSGIARKRQCGLP